MTSGTCARKPQGPQDGRSCPEADPCKLFGCSLRVYPVEACAGCGHRWAREAVEDRAAREAKDERTKTRKGD